VLRSFPRSIASGTDCRGLCSISRPSDTKHSRLAGDFHLGAIIGLLSQDSPQRLKAKCLAVFASSLGSFEFSIAPIRTNKAADLVSGSLPARQIISASNSILSSLQSSPLDSDISERSNAATMVSPASARRTRSARHGSFISRA